MPPVKFDPRWRSNDAVELARAIYDDPYPAEARKRLPILGDALMDAGCDDSAGLIALRQGEPEGAGRLVTALLNIPTQLSLESNRHAARPYKMVDDVDQAFRTGLRAAAGGPCWAVGIGPESRSLWRVVEAALTVAVKRPRKIRVMVCVRPVKYPDVTDLDVLRACMPRAAAIAEPTADEKAKSKALQVMSEDAWRTIRSEIAGAWMMRGIFRRSVEPCT